MTAGEQALSQAMMGYWATFASTLDSADLPLPGPMDWPPVASGAWVEFGIWRVHVLRGVWGAEMQ
jgi:hypothetical protein